MLYCIIMTYGYSDDLRNSCLSYYDKSGQPQKEVALMFGIGLKTLSNWIRLRKQGSAPLRSNQKARHCPKLDEHSLRSYIADNPDAYLQEIAEYFDVSIPAVHYAFKRLGITRKKTTLYAERDEAKRKKFLAEIKAIDPGDLVYLDESGIDRFLHREYTRSPRGKQVICDVKGNNYQRVSMIAAQCGKDILAPLVFKGTTDAKLFNHWLETCLVPELRPGQVVVMDNYCIHKTDETQKIIKKAGCRILFLPPYSPDLNPIEHLWALIKARIRKIKNSCDDFHSAINLAFQT